MKDSPIAIHAGPAALARLRQHGLRAEDVAAVPAAAGGPKGLIFSHLDAWLFGDWLPAAPRARTLIGASIGAWRMAAACTRDPAAAFKRLADLYCAQCYPRKPTAQLVSDTSRDFVAGVLGADADFIVNHPQHRLHVLTARGRRLLRAPRNRAATASGFGLAILGNLASRRHLAPHLGRVVFAANEYDPQPCRFDAFDNAYAPLREDNLEAALLASGTLPFIMEPVRDIPHAPPGTYWDGGLIDYHLALPYPGVAERVGGGLVLYPHFGARIVPGWFDKTLPWRHAASGKTRSWLDNVIAVSPSQSFLQRLSRGKLPDRNDFYYYGERHDVRALNWRLAVAEGERLRDALSAFVEKPDLGLVRPI